MEEQRVYPILLALTGRDVVVVGGGTVAERKVRGLVESPARIRVIAPALLPALERLAHEGAIAWEERPFAAGDCRNALLVFAATDDPAVNAAVVADARAAGALVNDASDGVNGDFTSPAVHRAGGLTVTVDSGGLSPSFTARIRDELALQVDARYARAAATLGAIRERVLAVVPPDGRAALMRHFAERDIDDLASMPPGAIEHEVERAADSLAGVRPSQPATLVCASRASALAMWQTRSIMARLASSGIVSTVLSVRTTGDAVQDRPVAALGSDSVFVKELELALRDGRADYAVHSCKDLPSQLPPDMALIAIAGRADARDAFCSERWPSFEALPPGARVGTSSPRRRAQLAALRPDLVYADIRGNVDTRLRKLRDGEYDALVLALAGLRRLGLAATHTVPFDPNVLVPAVAQGALAVEMRRDDPLGEPIRALLNDPQAELAVAAERTFLRELRAGCLAPAGAYAELDGDRLTLRAVIASPDGQTVLRRSATEVVRDRTAAESLGVGIALALLAAGGRELLEAIRPITPAPPVPDLSPRSLTGQLFVLPRTQDRPSRIAAALREEGAEVVEAAGSDAAEAALAGRSPTGLLFPSSGGVAAIEGYLESLRHAGGRPVVAAMGPRSAEAATAAGWAPDLVAPEADIGSFVQAVTRFVLENVTA